MKKCPFCAESIQDEAIKCRYCGSMIDVAAAADGPEGALLRAGRKIDAIKSLRERTGIGLKEAKDAVDALEHRLGLRKPSGSSLGLSLLFWLVLVVVGMLIWWFASPR